MSLLILRTRNTNPRKALFIYEKFCRSLAESGFLRAPHEGPLDFANRIASSNEALGQEVTRITRLYLDLRYTNNGCAPNAFIDSVRQFNSRH